MAFIRIALVAALAVAVIAEPLRYRRSQQLIAADAAIAAEGQGAATDNHQAAITVLGIPGSSGWNAPAGWGQEGSGWSSGGLPASLLVSNTGESLVGNQASLAEVTINDGQGNLSGLQQAEVAQVAAGDDQLGVVASGGDIALAASGASDASGSGSSAAAGELVIESNQSPSSYGMGKP